MPIPSLPLLGLGLLAGGTAAGLWLWQRQRRSFESTATVAAAYDRWTEDQLLERLWGDHVHLGWYGDPVVWRDFRSAKVDFVHELVRWSGLDQLPPGTPVLDVGCGIGGSARILARDYGFDVLGISISAAQVARARALTPEGLSCRFAVMDALALELEPESFGGVWSVEAGPTCPTSSAMPMSCCGCCGPVAPWPWRTGTRATRLMALRTGWSAGFCVSFWSSGPIRNSPASVPCGGTSSRAPGPGASR